MVTCHASVHTAVTALAVFLRGTVVTRAGRGHSLWASGCRYSEESQCGCTAACRHRRRQWV